MSPIPSGWLTLRSYSSGCAGSLGVRHVRDEGAGLAAGRSLGQPLDVEVVDVEVEVVEVVGCEQAARVEVVVLGEVVGHPVADDQDHAAAVAEQAADGEADEHHQHRHVEQQVARLAEVAALGGQRVLVLDDAVAPQQAAGPRQHGVGRLVGGVRRVVGQPVQPPRRGRRRRPHRLRVDDDPRDEAADERHHQQQVDRGEPRRGVDVEEAEPFVDRRQVRVVVLPPGGLDGVDALLRDDRARDGGQRQQEQQHQGGAHRGELAPRPAQQLAEGELAGATPGVGPDGLSRHQTLVSKVLTRWIWIQVTSSPHQPVTSSTPTATSISPPTRVTHCWWRRTHAKVPRARR